jgi:hypothetical protein
MSFMKNNGKQQLGQTSSSKRISNFGLELKFDDKHFLSHPFQFSGSLPSNHLRQTVQVSDGVIK